MEKKNAVMKAKAAIGICLLIIFLFVGVPFTIYGLYYLSLAVASGGGQGGYISLIVGLAMLAIGIVLLCGVKPSFLFVKRNLDGKDEGLTSKEIKLLVLLVTIPALYVLFSIARYEIYSITFEKSMQDFDIYYPTEEMTQSMNKRIKEKFSKHKTVFLAVRYSPPHSDESDDLEFFKSYYLKTIGAENIKNFNWDLKYKYFVAELTESGYENLLKSKYLRSVYFYDMRYGILRPVKLSWPF